MNYLALYVIAELDDFVFEAHKDSELSKEMVENTDGKYNSLYTVETSTSKFAGRLPKNILQRFPGI